MKPPSEDFEIAPNFPASAWKKLDIQASTNLSPSWEEAIKVFEKRIKARFLNQIDVMANNNDSNAAGFSGFAIVALDCLLIETLEQFYNGHGETPTRKRRRVWFFFWEKIKNPHVTAFHAVFQRSPELKVAFDEVRKTRVFYQQIRCGLLHQAQTKKGSKINRKNGVPITWRDEKRPKNGLIVHPLLFHKCIKDVFSGYVADLMNPSSHERRGLFREKMNGIAG